MPPKMPPKMTYCGPDPLVMFMELQQLKEELNAARREAEEAKKDAAKLRRQLDILRQTMQAKEKAPGEAGASCS